MYGEVNVLQIGNTDYSEVYNINEYVNWYYEDFNIDESKSFFQYDVAIIDRAITEEECRFIRKKVRAYGVFLLDDLNLDERLRFISKSRVARTLKREEIEDFINNKLRNFYTEDYGEKFSFKNFSVASSLNAQVKFEGGRGLYLSGDFGDEYKQIGYFRNNIPIFKNQAVEFFLEYEKDDTVSLVLEVDILEKKYTESILERKVFEKELLGDDCCVVDAPKDALIFVSIGAKGKGNLKLINLHDRWSRRGEGSFLPGGKRLVTSKREEIFTYFEPGDLKPPLNVYFSGYRTREGFEGYGMHRNLESPFLLFTDPRLEGGSFYIGSKEYEDIIEKEIRSVMRQLGFTRNELVMAGISMGTTGAIYYGSKIEPSYVLMGKPVINLGNVVERERIKRPGVFPTSLDFLRKNTSGSVWDGIEELNHKIWDSFDKADWNNTSFVVSHMLDDDYDVEAYTDLLGRMTSSNAKIYGRGLSGRHNDNTAGIVEWLLQEYKNIMQAGFSRKI